MNEKGHSQALEKMERKFFDEKVNFTFTIDLQIEKV